MRNVTTWNGGPTAPINPTVAICAHDAAHVCRTSVVPPTALFYTRGPWSYAPSRHPIRTSSSHARSARQTHPSRFAQPAVRTPEDFDVAGVAPVDLLRILLDQHPLELHGLARTASGSRSSCEAPGCGSTTSVQCNMSPTMMSWAHSIRNSPEGLDFCRVSSASRNLSWLQFAR